MTTFFDSPTGYGIGPVPGSEFGNKRPGHLHGGIDLNGAMGQHLISPRAGMVSAIRTSTGLGGHVIEIDHGVIQGRRHLTKHYHLGTKGGPLSAAFLPGIYLGCTLAARQEFAYCGDSGNASAPHDHYEHWIDGQAQDPLPWLSIYRKAGPERPGLMYPGSKGWAARYLQALLVYHGSTVKVDGVWGSGTTLALKSYQRNHGLDADGICGAHTWDALIPG